MDNIIILDEENLFNPKSKRTDKIQPLLGRSSLAVDIGWINVYVVDKLD